jgi:aquaporin Z
MIAALRQHWPEYLIEATCLGLFMISAGLFGTLLFAPSSPAVHWLGDGVAHRALMGLAMGGTAVCLIYSPLGRRSGAHMNPATTLTFLRLGKVAPWDAVFYILAQLLGGAAGVGLVAAALGPVFTGAPVRSVATLPGPGGVWPALAAEIAITFGLMLTVLTVSNSARWMTRTGLCAGALVALYITFEAPISGMSMNPARTFASALPSGLWTGYWIYVAGPLTGMLLAAQAYVSWRGVRAVYCAKYDHGGGYRCIFRCRHGELEAQAPL